MKTKTSKPCECGKAIDASKGRERLLLSPDDEVFYHQTHWTPADIAEPEPWTLASFSDLLPHEMV